MRFRASETEEQRHLLLGAPTAAIHVRIYNNSFDYVLLSLTALSDFFICVRCKHVKTTEPLINAVLGRRMH